MPTWTAWTCDIWCECATFRRSGIGSWVFEDQPCFVVYRSSSSGFVLDGLLRWLPVLAREELLHSTSSACELSFRLLGIDFADTGKKAVPFSDFKMLGLVVNTINSVEGSITITHTDERKRRWRPWQQCWNGSLSPKEAERLQGRMVQTMFSRKTSLTSCVSW